MWLQGAGLWATVAVPKVTATRQIRKESISPRDVQSQGGGARQRGKGPCRRIVAVLLEEKRGAVTTKRSVFFIIFVEALSIYTMRRIQIDRVESPLDV